MNHTPAEAIPSPRGIMVCFQFVTKGGAVIDTEPELWDSIVAATRRAEEWMNLPEQKTISFVNYEGDGAVVRAGEIEHAAVIPAAKMAALYREAAETQENEK